MPRRSLLIGVQAYHGDKGLGPLTCPLADVAAVERIFGDMRYAGDGATVVLLKDPTSAQAAAGISQFLLQVERDDVCLFYFSGHGMRDASGDLFLCFTDSDERDLELSALNVKRLRAVFDSRHLRRVLVVLDCCYSGAAGVPLTKDSLGSKLNEVEEARADGTGLYVLSSAGVAETAKEGVGQSVFTHFFVRGIETGEADRDGRGEITVQDIARYVAARVPENAPGQKPLLSSRAVAGTFTVALNDAARRQRLASEAARKREAVLEAATTRLIEAHRAKDVSRAFMLEVLDWMERTPQADPERWPMPLLAGYGARALGLDQFVREWKGETEPAQAKERPRSVQVAGFSSQAAPGPEKGEGGERSQGSSGGRSLLVRMVKALRRDSGLTAALVASITAGVLAMFVLMLDVPVEPAPPDEIVVSGDPEAGERVFRQCQACHQIGEGAQNRVGPPLTGIADRPAASVDGFRYSSAMQAHADQGLVWTADNLRAYLTNPREFVPGTSMAFAGLRSADDLENLIAYLVGYE